MSPRPSASARFSVKTLAGSSERNWVALLCAWSLVLIGLYLVVWLYVDPGARYYGIDPVSSLSKEFLKPYFEQVGGPLDCLCTFLAQLDYFPALGAIIPIALVVPLSLSTHFLLRRSGRELGLAWAVPALVILLLYSHYRPGVFELASGASLAIASLILWISLSFQPFARSLLVFSGLATVLFYAAGPLVALLFISLGGLHQTLWRRDARSSLGCWLCLLVWAVGTMAVGTLDPTGLWRRLGDGEKLLAVAGLYGFLPGTWLALWIWSRLQASTALAPGKVNPSQGTHRQVPPAAVRTWFWINQPSQATAAVALLALTFNADQRALLRVQAEAERQNWTGVLQAATRLRECPAPTRLQINRALFHTGRLNVDLFSLPQRAGEELLPSLSDGLDVCLPLAETFSELGQVNLAEHYAHEALELQGERPEVLWLLAWINFIKERPEAARVFLNRLAEVPFNQATARRWLASLDRDPAMSSEPQIIQARARRITVNSVERRFRTEDLLKELLRPDQENRMASEYLLANFLLTRQPEQIIQNLDLLASASTSVPRHLAEAILSVTHGNLAGTADLRGHRIDAETRRRYEEFCRVLSRTNATTLRPAALAAFSDTYWFYDVFGWSGSRAALAFSKAGL